MSPLKRQVGPSDHSEGPDAAPITLVEYGDFQCPFCGAAYGELKKVRQTLGDRLRFVFRNFPIAQLHPHAVQAAEAAESAGAQGRFWQMHDVLFERQRDLRLSALTSYAKELNLDLGQFNEDLREHRYQEAIKRSFLEGARSGVNGTPTLFLNGERYDGPHTFADILWAVEAGGAYAE
jgi:protein-disulfide isomerase